MAKTKRLHVHVNGDGLKVMNPSEVWHGDCCCNICGSQKYEPVMVRYWDMDEGWTIGTLCKYCGEECTFRGPEPEDYAWKDRDPGLLDVAEDLLDGDLDGLVSMVGQYKGGH